MNNARISYKNAEIQKKIVSQKELTLIKQMHQKSVRIAIFGTLEMLDLNLKHMFVINVMMF